MQLVQVRVTRPLSIRGESFRVGAILEVSPAEAGELHASTRACVIDDANWPAINEAMHAKTAREERAAKAAAAEFAASSLAPRSRW